MKTRRDFLKAAGLAGITIPLSACSTNAQSSNSQKQEGIKPIIISTWSHGMDANKVGFDILMKGGSALDAVEKGVVVVENDPTNQTVGIGGFPDREGIVTLDACIMKGDGSCGAVAFLQEIKNPISVARKVMEETPHIMLVGAGAKKFAIEQGFIIENLLTPKSKEDYLKWLKTSEYTPEINIENHDTISTLALDANGKIAGACTTSGAAWKMHGRVGDSPLIGAGLFVDDEAGAAAATGLGEAVIRTAGSAMVVEAMRNGLSPFDACKEVVDRIKRKHKSLKDLQVGFLALDMKGNYGAYSIHPGFNYAIGSQNGHVLIDAKSMY
ncbi:UNVERIFIED_CONTAM: hypothetical protein GTU68_013773 [Idotea baltica]|nr:hypothetical protein [Idotea baltica]